MKFVIVYALMITNGAYKIMRFFNIIVNKNKGFTLVELITALVILSIIAAIIFPALLSYIDTARANGDIVEARNCMQAAQIEFMNQYAYEISGEGEKNGKSGSVFPKYGMEKGKNGNGDIDLTEVPSNAIDYADRVFRTAGVKPYLLIVGVGKRDIYVKPGEDLRKAYTCYICMYMKDENSKPVFFDGKKWTRDYPGNSKSQPSGIPKDKNVVFDNNNKLLSKNVTIQYYMFANGGGHKVTSNDVWSFLRKKAAGIN